MSVRTSSAGLRSESLFDRIRAERKRRDSGSGARRLAHLAELLGNGPENRPAPSHSLRPASLKGRKSR
jgi:hypothetical protein